MFAAEHRASVLGKRSREGTVSPLKLLAADSHIRTLLNDQAVPHAIVFPGDRIPNGAEFVKPFIDWIDARSNHLMFPPEYYSSSIVRQAQSIQDIVQKHELRDLLQLLRQHKLMEFELPPYILYPVERYLAIFSDNISDLAVPLLYAFKQFSDTDWKEWMLLFVSVARLFVQRIYTKNFDNLKHISIVHFECGSFQCGFENTICNDVSVLNEFEQYWQGVHYNSDIGDLDAARLTHGKDPCDTIRHAIRTLSKCLHSELELDDTGVLYTTPDVRGVSVEHSGPHVLYTFDEPG